LETMEHARPRFIKDMREGEKVSVVGLVVSKSETGYIILDDGTGQATILVPNDEVLESIRPGEPIRVIGSVIGEGEIRSYLVQSMQGLDMELYREYMKLREKLKREKGDN